MIISSFDGEHHFLSNFALSPITVDGITYPTVEHAFQAHKTLDTDLRADIAGLSTPHKAKRAGRQVKLRPDWDDVRIDVMRACLRRKFAQGTKLAERLADTGDAVLVEGNTWGDRFWGVDGDGENRLGLLLMERRTELAAVGPPERITLCARCGYPWRTNYPCGRCGGVESLDYFPERRWAP